MSGQRYGHLVGAIMVMVSMLMASGEQAWARSQTRFRLVYERFDDALSACPPIEAFTIHLRGRLGYDPTDFRAKELIHVAIASPPAPPLKGRRPIAKVTMTVAWLAPDGIRRGERRLTGRLERCEALIKDAALAIALAVDPEAVEAVEAGRTTVRLPRRVATTSTSRRPRRTLLEGPRAPQAPPPRPTLRGLTVGIGTMFSTLLGREGTPVSLEGALTLYVGGDAWSAYARANLSGVWPQSVGSQGRFDVLTPTGEVGACGRLAPMAFCGMVAAGEVIARGYGNRDGGIIRRGAYATTGLRVRVALSSEASVIPMAELLVAIPITPVRLIADGREILAAWPVTLGLGFGAHFSVPQ